MPSAISCDNATNKPPQNTGKPPKTNDFRTAEKTWGPHANARSYPQHSPSRTVGRTAVSFHAPTMHRPLPARVIGAVTLRPQEWPHSHPHAGKLTALHTKERAPPHPTRKRGGAALNGETPSLTVTTRAETPPRAHTHHPSTMRHPPAIAQQRGSQRATHPNTRPATHPSRGRSTRTPQTPDSGPRR